MVHRHRAFSLLELIIVMLIIGITAAIAAPRFSDAMRVARLRAAANQLAAHIDYIRNVARNEARATSLICDNKLHSYRSPEVDFPDRRGERIEVQLLRDYDADFRLVADFDDATTLAFDFEGTPYVGSDPMASGQVLLRVGSDAFGVIITPGTGQTVVTQQVLRDGDFVDVTALTSKMGS